MPQKAFEGVFFHAMEFAPKKKNGIGTKATREVEIFELDSSE